MSESAVVATTHAIQAHRVLAEEGVQQFYACEGLPPPLTLWLRSPREGAKVTELLASVQSHGPLAGNDCLWDIVGKPDEAGPAVIDEQLLNDVRAQIWNRGWGITAKGIGHQFDASTHVIKSRLKRRIPRYYPIWPNTVGCFNVIPFDSTDPAIALANLETWKHCLSARHLFQET